MLAAKILEYLTEKFARRLHQTHQACNIARAQHMNPKRSDRLSEKFMREQNSINSTNYYCFQ
jgi:hypothetical protein